jgi:anaerobic magnesium-protoporphyrin IX monomethyl ester cyclase
LALVTRKKTGVKIALVNPPTNPEAFVDYQIPLIGLAYIAAVLEKKGYKIAVLDCPPLNMTHEELRRKITRLKPDIVGITSVTATFPSVLQAVHAIKEACPNVPVVLGGPHATFMDKQILNGNKEVDIVVRCEGEQTISDLVSHISNSGLKDLCEVAGITFRKNGQIVRTPNRPFIQDLDELPRPAYKYFPLSKYRIFGKLILPIVTSRGCPYPCTFCMVPQMLGKRLRARSKKNVADELEWLRDEYGADAYTFNDEIFTYDQNRVIEICEEMKRRKISLPWSCQTRVDHVSKRVLAKMSEANCELVHFGVESGSQKILDVVSKQTSIQQNENAIKWAKEAGLVAIISLMVGHPGETEDTLRQSLDFARRLKPDDAWLCVATPYPGTELYRFIKEKGWEMDPDWSLYDTTTPVFENPSISKEKILEMRRKFVDDFYSVSYILRHMFKRNFYSHYLARVALNHLVWRIRTSL